MLSNLFSKPVLNFDALILALENLGIPTSVERVDAVFHDYTNDIEMDATVAELFGDVKDDREDQGDRLVCTAPAHIRVLIGHIYLVFTELGNFVRVYAPEDGGPLPAHMPEEG